MRLTCFDLLHFFDGTESNLDLFVLYVKQDKILFVVTFLWFNRSQTQRSPHVFYRHDLINQLQTNHALVTLVAENLSAYMESMRQYAKGKLIENISVVVLLSKCIIISF